MAPRHPLQRLGSPSRTVSLLIHLIGIASFTASFRYLSQFPNQPADAFGGNYQFLTIIGLTIAFVSFVFGALADISSVPLFFDIKNFLAVCAAPLEVLVSVLYWGLCLIDKSLVFPPELQLPFLPDFGFHAAPAILLTIDLLVLSPPWAIKAQGALGLSLALAFLYWGWVEYCFSYNGFYPYPIFELLSTTQRMLLFTFSAVLMTVSTMILKWVYGKINGIEKFQKEALQPAKLD